MAIKRYVAMTNRDAMAQVRRDLGEDAVILSNKRIAGGRIEIVAAAPEAMASLVEDARVSRGQQRRAEPQAPLAAAPSPLPGESFQAFVRRQSGAPAAPATAAPRGVAPALRAADVYRDVAAADDSLDAFEDALAPAPLRRSAPAVPQATPPASHIASHTASHTAPRTSGPPTMRQPAPRATQPQPAPQPQQEEVPAVFRRRQAEPAPRPAPPQAPAHAMAQRPAVAQPVAAAVPVVMVAPVVPAQPAIAVAAPAVAPQAAAAAVPHEMILPPAQTAPVVAAQAPAERALMAELHTLRSALQEQLATLTSSVALAQANDAQRRNPLQARLMTRLLTAGFTPEVARRIGAHTPPGLDATAAENWLLDVLSLNVRCATEAETPIERGGVYALVGPTGVGKTTTVAKLAARYAVKYGTSTLGLITLDAYRVAAHEQLRTYGRILGTPVHLAQDGATLRELLVSMQAKRLVLIDTGGVGPRDPRLVEMLGMLEQAGSGTSRVQPVLLLNAASHAETLDEAARAWQAPKAAGCILTKLDEAARIGGAIDCAMRFKLALLGLTNGQRVPEDWHLASARLLAHLALKPAGQLFALDEGEGALLAQPAAAAALSGAVHAG
jgi:flagellar biosynthesis protein FlhF